jgi:outer membrane protein assembly factor BamA
MRQVRHHLPEIYWLHWGTYIYLALPPLRFQLGGPSLGNQGIGGTAALRGFEFNGTGPRALRPNVPVAAEGAAALPSNAAHRTDSLGGDLRSTLLATLSVPLPIPALKEFPVRAFAFVNAGTLSSLTPAGAIAGASGLSALRASVGGGFSAKLGLFRMELTYALPVLCAPHDQRKKFQLGFGATLG